MRICRLLTRPNLGGPTRQAGALYQAHRALGARTLLVVGRCEAGETALRAAELGVPELPLAEAMERGPEAEGWVELESLRRRIHLARDRRAGQQLRALLRTFRPDVVHTHTSKAGLLGRRAARAVGVPLVAHTFHGHVLRGYYGPLRSRLLALFERRAARHTDLLCAVSPSCADELAELGVAPRERIALVPPAVPLTMAVPEARQQARQRLGIGTDEWVVACAGRLVEVKRMDRFVAAVALVPDLTGRLFGDGPLRPELERMAVPRVRLCGADPDLPALLPAFDALVVPSAREGCPLVALEAFAAGVPVVGFDVPGVRDVLGPWGGGVMVPEREGPRGLADALHRLKTEPGLAARCIAAGRSGLFRFEPAAVAAGLLRSYRSGGRDPGDGPGGFA
jgi:glycosyltransferase involved in cell wall biosynthesis